MVPIWDELGPYVRLVHTELVEPRSYQLNIASSISTGKNTLVVLPTGLGKTLIAILAIAQAINEGRRAILLAPTKPLSEQHHGSLVRLLNINPESIALLTGTSGKSARRDLEANAKVIAATPQTIANDLKSGALSLDGFGIIIFDECHKAVGKYAYTYIADEAKLKRIQLLGLTASPGSNRKKIDALIDVLGIENIEIRISVDPDVEQYVMDKSMTVVYVEKGPTINTILGTLKPVIDKHLGNLYHSGLSPFNRFENMPKGRLIEIGRNIDKIQARNYKFNALFNYVYVLDLLHAYELVSSEGINPFVKYFEGLQNRQPQSRAAKSILNNEEVGKALRVAREALERGEEHNKVIELVKLLKTQLNGKSVIVFAQFRSTAKMISDILGANGIDSRTFMGKKEGLTQAQQQQTIAEFRENKFRVLVATSIGEEGLDIPSVDAVVFYEPIPSEIRSIQRKGRAGRLKFGEVITLVAKDTKDEMYLMVSRMREKRMRDILMKIKASMAAASLTRRNENLGQRTL
jgi:Fanconi anemia group M protein